LGLSMGLQPQQVYMLPTAAQPNRSGISPSYS
jgi:hypothetical protein